MAEILYGIRESDKKIISIADILNLPNPDIMRGNRCGCLCPNPACGKPLLAKLGKGLKNGGRQPHFSHFPDFEGFCSSAHANETALHMMAKDIIAEELCFVAPDEEITWEDVHINNIPAEELAKIPTYIHPIGGVFNCFSVTLEKRLQGIIPDIIALTPFGECLIEISVTHPVTVEKKLKTEELQLPMLEIDLSDYKNKIVTKENLREILLKVSNRIHWIYYKDKESILFKATQYYQTNPLTIKYIEDKRKRDAELQEIYAANTAKYHTRRTTYNPKQYRSKYKPNNGEVVVDASNVKEYLEKGLAYYRKKNQSEKKGD